VKLDTTEIDTFLATSLRDPDSIWPGSWPASKDSDHLLERIDYHGIAGLLCDKAAVLSQWPSQVMDAIRERALAQSMWELRHKLVLRELFDRFASAGIRALLLKGTAIAYDLYDSPASRARGDTDLLIGKDSIVPARAVLEECGFGLDQGGQDLSEKLRLQEIWLFTSEDGTRHSIDLHWQPLNTPALERILIFAEVAADSRNLPRLSDTAVAPSRPTLLFHTCLHRGLHDCSPFFVGGRTYFGGNRLIWLYDIALLSRALSDDEWHTFECTAVDKQMSGICLQGLIAAEERLGPVFPSFVREALSRARSGRYFRSGQFGRAVLDMWATRGVRRKWDYFRARSLPSPDFIRAKYPDMDERSLPALYLRRFVELLRERPRGHGDDKQ
jgi:hypothetical protein